MTIQLRSMTQADVEPSGRICFEAFKGIAERYNFPLDFPTAEHAIQITQSMLSSPLVFSVVAEDDGQIVGSNHLWEFDEIRAVGPISVDPETQSKGVGRMLMQATIDRGKGTRGIRLVQDAFNATSLSLYASLGFEVVEPLVLIRGVPKDDLPADVEVRSLEEKDLAECAELCRTAHCFDRNNELQATPAFLPSFVAVRNGKVSAYASAPHFWALNQAVAETEEDMHAVLIGASRQNSETPLSFLLPIREANLFRWCLKQGLRVVKPMNLMSMGEYHAPARVYLPSVGY